MKFNLIAASAIALCISAALAIENLQDPGHQCRRSVGNFSTAHSLMITCILENAEPSRFCLNCIKPKQLMVSKYKFLLENATDKSGAPCRSIYIDSHLHLVEDLYTSTMLVWNNAFCDDCWNAAESNLSDTAQIFFDDVKDYQQCIKNHSDAVCIKCESRYEKLSKYYDTIRLNKANQVCYDITDAVNKTRKSWSLDFKCCNDKSTDLTVFFSMAGLVGAMPLIFYLVMFLYTRRTERNSQNLLSDQPEADEPSTSSGVRPATTREANDSDLHKRPKAAAGSEGQSAADPLIDL